MNRANHKPITSKQREKQRAVALAALTQASALVESIAQTGQCDQVHFEECINALLDENYFNNRHFSIGKSKLKRMLSGREVPYTKAIMSHSSTLSAIEKKLIKQPLMLGQIAKGMEHIQKQVQYFGSSHHPNVYAGIAHLYGETISTLSPRVIIRGKPEHLKQSQNTEKVRCLLFSGLRAAWTWRTNGGNTFRILFGSNKIIHQLNQTVEQP